MDLFAITLLINGKEKCRELKSLLLTELSQSLTFMAVFRWHNDSRPDAMAAVKNLVQRQVPAVSKDYVPRGSPARSVTYRTRSQRYA
jgi:NADPH-dependent 7-cyano-7-deazaguanine reductase QueF